MKHFGTVKSYDEASGEGRLQPEQGGEELRFDKSAFQWGASPAPKAGQRLSYDVGPTEDRERRAINLQTI